MSATGNCCGVCGTIARLPMVELRMSRVAGLLWLCDDTRRVMSVRSRFLIRTVPLVMSASSPAAGMPFGVQSFGFLKLPFEPFQVLSVMALSLWCQPGTIGSLVPLGRLRFLDPIPRRLVIAKPQCDRTLSISQWARYMF